MSRDPLAAGMPRRALASAIDVALASGAMLTGVIAWALIAHRGRPIGERVDAGAESLRVFFADPRVVRALKVGDPVGRVLGRHLQTPGLRVAGIRRVDARTGGPESVRSAILQAFSYFALQHVMQRVNAPARRRFEARSAEQQRVSTQLRATLADDPEALERASIELGRARGRGCLIAMARALVIGQAPALTALLSPRRQTLIDRLAGVAVIRERRGLRAA